MDADAPMRVGNLTASVSRQAGGVFQAVRNLAISTQSLGHQVTVFGLRDEFTEADLPAWQSVPVRIHNVVGPRSFGFSPRLVASIQDSGIDLLHLHGLWMYPSVASLRVSRRGKLASVVSPHGMLDPWAVRNSGWKKKLAMRFYEGAHLRAAACLQALCESEAASLRTLGLRNPIAWIPLGVELPPPAATERHNEDNDFAPGRKALLFLGRLHPKKGLANLLRAWAICQKTQPEAAHWNLVVAGWDQGGHEGLLKRMVGELGITGSVQFPGPLFDGRKDRALRSAQAFVLPSFSEGLPVAALEAWAWRLPILMTPQCNLPEGFTEGAAIQAEPDVGFLIEGLQVLFSMNASDREEMGARGRRLVEQRFSWNNVAKQTTEVYRWVLGGGPRPDCVQGA
jgi:glycosyltransferase involved in cell wall biosynthesis